MHIVYIIIIIGIKPFSDESQCDIAARNDVKFFFLNLALLDISIHYSIIYSAL